MNSSVVSRSLGSYPVRGSYSAKVPRSSLVGVAQGILSLHTMEEEGEDQENEQDDRRAEEQQEVEGRVAERVRTNTS